MAEYKYIQELLNTGKGTEGSLLIPKKIYGTLIEEVQKSLIPRELAAIYFGPDQIPGNSVDINLETPNTGDVRVVGEGAEIPLTEFDVTSTNLKPVKYGAAIRITRELIEDSAFNLLQRNVAMVGRRIAENENSLVVTALDGAANTVSGGAAITIANITRAMQYLEDSDYTATDFVIGMEVLNDLRNIDTFVEFSRVGNTDMIQRGFQGTIYGANVIKVSTNAGMTATSSYVLDRGHGYAIAEKRPVAIENFELPLYDMSAVAITHRITVKALRTSAIAKITTS